MKDPWLDQLAWGIKFRGPRPTFIDTQDVRNLQAGDHVSLVAYGQGHAGVLEGLGLLHGGSLFIRGHDRNRWEVTGFSRSGDRVQPVLLPSIQLLTHQPADVCAECGRVHILVEKSCLDSGVYPLKEAVEAFREAGDDAHWAHEDLKDPDVSAEAVRGKLAELERALLERGFAHRNNSMGEIRDGLPKAASKGCRA